MNANKKQSNGNQIEINESHRNQIKIIQKSKRNHIEIKYNCAKSNRNQIEIILKSKRNVRNQKKSNRHQICKINGNQLEINYKLSKSHRTNKKTKWKSKKPKQ